MTRTKISLLALLASMWALPALCGNINLPGYETITLKAGQVPQAVSFSNPQENTCAFRLSISLKDGSTLWEAENLLRPGEALLSIDLTRELEAGTYRNAVLKYECYNLADMTKLNGAEMKCTLVVE